LARAALVALPRLEDDKEEDCPRPQPRLATNLEQR
jgi:hypothetical protein